MRTQAVFILYVSLLLSGPAVAEVYKWVDENGKVQFSDKAPAESSAENIEEKLKKTNVDEASKNISSGVIASTEKNSDEEMLELKKRQALEEKIGAKCRKWQEEINAIAEGRYIVFYDKDGNEELVLERDRGKKLLEWREGYQEYGCGQLYPLE